MNIEFSRKNKILISAIGFLVVLAIALTAWNYSYNRAKQIVNPNNEEVLYTKLTTDGNSIYYFSKIKNALMKWDLKNNKVETWITFSFQNTAAISYSPDMSMALVYLENPENSFDANTWLINLNDRKTIKELGKNILNTDWSPDSKKIAYQYFDWDNNINYLAISNPEGSNENKLIDIDFETINVTWVNNSDIMYYNLPSETFITSINMISIINKKVTVITDKYIVGEANKLLDQNKILIDIDRNDLTNTTLNLIDTKTNKITDLKSSAIVNKTTISIDKKTIYTAYNSSDVNSAENDKFQSINLDNFTIKNLPVKFKGDLIVTNIMISPDSNILYFISSNNLYKINI